MAEMWTVSKVITSDVKRGPGLNTTIQLDFKFRKSDGFVVVECTTDNDIRLIPFGICYYYGDVRFTMIRLNMWRFDFDGDGFKFDAKNIFFDIDIKQLVEGPQRRGSFFNQFLHRTLAEDYTIIVNGHLLHVNKDFFATRSTTFQAELGIMPNECMTENAWTFDKFEDLKTVHAIGIMPITCEILHAILLIDQGWIPVTRKNAAHIMRQAMLLGMKNVVHHVLLYLKSCCKLTNLEAQYAIEYYTDYVDVMESKFNGSTGKNFLCDYVVPHGDYENN